MGGFFFAQTPCRRKSQNQRAPWPDKFKETIEMPNLPSHAQVVIIGGGVGGVGVGGGAGCLQPANSSPDTASSASHTSPPEYARR